MCLFQKKHSMSHSELDTFWFSVISVMEFLFMSRSRSGTNDFAAQSYLCAKNIYQSIYPLIQPIKRELKTVELWYFRIRKVLRDNQAHPICFKFIYFWLCWVFVAEGGLSLVAVSGATLCCSVQASHCGGFSFYGAWALGSQASVVVAHGL